MHKQPESIPSQDSIQPPSKLPSFAGALVAAERMQRDWLEQGINFVDVYVNEVDGNWLDQWDEDTTEGD